MTEPSPVPTPSSSPGSTPPADLEPESTAVAEVAPLPETGNPAVDEVLASLDGLHERPVREHVAVFESAHTRLRAALQQPGESG